MSEYQTETIHLNQGEAAVVVRETTGLDLISALALYSQLDYNRNSPRERKWAEQFIDAFQRSEVSGSLGFAWPVDDTDATQLQTAFEGWKQLSRTDMATWFNALDRVNKKTLNPNG